MVVSQPTVVCVMLTAGSRPAFARRAVDAYNSQTYENKQLICYQTTDDPVNASCAFLGATPTFHVIDLARPSIGELRNRANRQLSADILIHWDDDDYSHPNRIAEQVALLQSSGADCVGYREMLFWRSSRYHMTADETEPSEAWLYSNPDPRYCLGTSLCYWRKTWEHKPFEATSQGEDERFTTGLNCVGVSAMLIGDDLTGTADDGIADPRMVARIHAGNTSNGYDPTKMARAAEWRRVPEWDSYCRATMEAA